MLGVGAELTEGGGVQIPAEYMQQYLTWQCRK